MTEQGPAIIYRTPIFALLSAEAVSQVGNMLTIVTGPWFVLQKMGRTAKTTQPRRPSKAVLSPVERSS